jgi:hypothetical protein
MEDTTPASARLIGGFFVEKGLVTQEQLELALLLQEQTGARLGEIIIGEFGVSRLELAGVLAEQWAEFERRSRLQPVGELSAADTVAVAGEGVIEPQLRRPIGDILVERGLVSAAQLERAFEVQRETGQLLGEILVVRGFISRIDLASALAEHWSTVREPHPREPVEAPRELRRMLQDLEARVRAVERSAAAGAWRDALSALSEEVSAAMTALERRLDQVTLDETRQAGIAELRGRIDEIADRVSAPAAMDAVVERLAALEARMADATPIDEIREEVRRIAASSADDRASLEQALLARVDEFTAMSGPHDDVAEVRGRLDELAARPVADEELRARVDALERRAASELSDAGSAARLDELAARLAAAAAGAEQSLRADLDRLAATVEERDAAAIEAREELREELERRLDALVSQQEEQVRVTERALRKGLASLGERLAGSQAEYSDAGDALRRSIERLGAAVVEADARIAERGDESGRGERFERATACIAFVPTEKGYRLVELAGPAPVAGGTVEVPGCEGSLIVSRVGSSPLPLDDRPCAYLERR